MLGALHAIVGDLALPLAAVGAGLEAETPRQCLLGVCNELVVVADHLGHDDEAPEQARAVRHPSAPTGAGRAPERGDLPSLEGGTRPGVARSPSISRR